MKKYEYTGKVKLGCQEGGFASPRIMLMDIPGGSNYARDINSVIRAMGGGSSDIPVSLDEVMEEAFNPQRINDLGDQDVGTLKITIEKVE